MVAGKVKAAIGLTKSQPNPPPSPSPSPSSAKVQKGTSFSRSFGGYFPRSSAQVQPRPPDVTELIRLVEELRERESRLKTELLENKLLKESVAILPVLEEEIARKDGEIELKNKTIDFLESQNDELRRQVDNLHCKLSQKEAEYEENIKSLEDQVSALRKAAQFSEEMASSQRFQSKNLKKSASLVENYNFSKIENEVEKSKNKVTQISEEMTEIVSVTARSRIPRVPKPPPRPTLIIPQVINVSSAALSPSSSNSSCSSENFVTEDSALSGISVAKPRAPPPPPPPPRPVATKSAPAPAPPPPPPPPMKGAKNGAQKVRRVPEVVEFYHSLMRRDSRRDSGNGAAAEVAATANARDMIGEIENRSTHLLAIKTDVETQGDFIRFLIKEVENAAFTDIQDVVPFVKWLDDELSYLVDERAVLKHFEWPEQKADTLREAAFGFSDLKKLESEVSSFRDDPRQHCAPALKKMQALFEKLEHGVYNLSRMRESAANRYKGFQIPMDWMMDTGYVTQIKLASVKLAMKYMRRVSAELENVDGGPEEEELIVQGVRFAFRVHQFAGGFDAETMRAFEELRDKARSCHIQCQSQQQQKYICRSTAC
ncbi:hypothetical protein DCAR_0205883 [Daucus carota subsp. sativus]|uniref:Uncharacterized protein n=1 Tax=Daucus carota subsp. sativus TaxID=79200 RepID=A0A166CVR6_DAUCS|nr:PREDICTED: protein CHUP1, chloroplastic-like [Daucus carota subsp. sativus]WOG86666.1 hypothetical protein DCAR_0205883 [Daucus carota subsp. sativus]